MKRALVVSSLESGDAEPVRLMGARPVDRWLERLLGRVTEDEDFRVQALRFVDVLPALDDDRELTRHLPEYFGEEGFPLPPLVAFGPPEAACALRRPAVRGRGRLPGFSPLGPPWANDGTSPWLDP